MFNLSKLNEQIEKIVSQYNVLEEKFKSKIDQIKILEELDELKKRWYWRVEIAEDKKDKRELKKRFDNLKKKFNYYYEEDKKFKAAEKKISNPWIQHLMKNKGKKISTIRKEYKAVKKTSTKKESNPWIEHLKKHKGKPLATVKKLYSTKKKSEERKKVKKKDQWLNTTVSSRIYAGEKIDTDIKIQTLNDDGDVRKILAEESISPSETRLASFFYLNNYKDEVLKSKKNREAIKKSVEMKAEKLLKGEQVSMSLTEFGFMIEFYTGELPKNLMMKMRNGVYVPLNTDRLDEYYNRKYTFQESDITFTDLMSFDKMMDLVITYPANDDLFDNPSTDEQRKHNEDAEFLVLKSFSGRGKPGGAFFKYYNKTPIDLSRYGIIKNESEMNEIINTNCLMQVFEEYKKDGFLEDDEFSIARHIIKNSINSGHISRVVLKDIASALKLTIKLIIPEPKSQKRKNVYYPLKNRPKRELHICLIDNHYFMYDDDTGYTKKYLLHSALLEQHMLNKFIRKNYETKFIGYTKDGKPMFRKDKTIDSYILVKTMLETPTLVERIPRLHLIKTFLANSRSAMLCNTSNNGIVFVDDNFTIPDKGKKVSLETKYCGDVKVISGKKITKIRHTAYFDVETTTDGEIHKEYLICTVEDTMNEFKAYYKVEDFLNSIENDMVFISHNLRYDFQFLLKFMSSAWSPIMTGNKLKSIICTYSNKTTKKLHTLVFKDSHALVPRKLSKFVEMFGIKIEESGLKSASGKKEVMPYEFYNNELIDLYDKGMRYAAVDEVKKMLSETDYKIFIENCENWNLLKKANDGSLLFHFMDYSKNYCFIDCYILKAGYRGYQDGITRMSNELGIRKINIKTCISTPQIANVLGKMYGVFDGIAEISGEIREYLQKFVIGGKCMTANDDIIKLSGGHKVVRTRKSGYTEEKVESKVVKLANHDAVSLYPSAMVSMGGFLKGKPKLLPKDLIGHKIGAPELITLSSYSGYFVTVEITHIGKERAFPTISAYEDGVRRFTNKCGVYHMDKFLLEETIRWHEIEFKILEGVYFNDGRNNKIESFIRTIFEKRLVLKKDNNPLEGVYKLIMNGFYGRTIMKPVGESTEFKTDDEIEKHIAYSYNKLKYIVKIPDSKLWLSKVSKETYKHKNWPHVGSEILSYSKKLMNRMIYTAEDLGIDGYYMDTDSFHYDANGTDELVSELKKKYNFDMIGKSLCQFNSDWEFSRKQNGEAVGIEAYYLGKKMYYEKCEYKEHGNDKTLIGEHVRMKAINASCLSDTYKDKKEPFERLFNGETLQFDMIKYCFMQSNRNFTTQKREEFVRTISINKLPSEDNLLTRPEKFLINSCGDNKNTKTYQS